MHVNCLLRMAKIAESELSLILENGCADMSKENMLINFMEKYGNRLFNIDFRNLDSEPFLGLTAPQYSTYIDKLRSYSECS